MSNPSQKKLIPYPILVILLTAGVLGMRMVFDLPPISAHEKALLKDFIIILLFILVTYFILKKPLADIRDKFLEKAGSKAFDPEEIKALVPENFNLEIVQDKGFAFAYPKTWFITAASDPALYKEVREQMVDPGILGARNFNISIHDIRVVSNMDKVFQSIIAEVLKALKTGKLEFKQKFKNPRTQGMVYKVAYKNMQGLDLACYQVVMTTSRRKKMLIFTFTSQINDFAQSRLLFDQITALTRIFD
ncbi:MAG: hypothetical protein KKD05_02205 [Candidatus Omnitrophica bacterium]|nr:hypothetical protein [Candidatus Omnitrophota bacterium]